MKEPPLHVQIRPIAESDVRRLEWHLAQDFMAADKHRERFIQQEAGEVVYLVAWYDDTPIGHVLLNWQGATNPKLASIRDCPDLIDLFVHPSFRSRGVGSQLLAAVESLVMKRGYLRVGLAVALDNVRARRLYKRHGYVDAGFRPYPERWSRTTGDGKTHWFEQTCVYLTKALGRPVA